MRSSSTIGSTPHAAYTVGIDSRESDGQSYYDGRQVAYDNGYREGSAAAARMPRAIAGPSISNASATIATAISGYNRSFGDRDRYRDELPQRLR